MSEIINLHVGECGNCVAEFFWSGIRREHGLDEFGALSGNEDQLGLISVNFDESQGGTFRPRAVLVDSDPSIRNFARSSPLRNLFRLDSLVLGDSGGTNRNWAKGQFRHGARMLEPLFDVLRKEAERCSRLQGFTMTHSLGGGTGSGFGSLIMTKIRDEYPGCIIATNSVLSSPNRFDEAVEPYNVILSLNQLLQNADLTYCMDLEALVNICMKKIGKGVLTYYQIDHLIAQTMSGISTSLRFPGCSVMGDLRRVAQNMVPFPRLHFLSPGSAPLARHGCKLYRTCTVEGLAKKIFQKENFMLDCDPRSGTYLAAAAFFRGPFAITQVEKQITALKDMNSSQFVEWIPDNVNTAVFDTPAYGMRMSATSFGNCTAIQKPFKSTLYQYKKLFQRKLYVHKYTSEGMDVSEFNDAETNIMDLVLEYQAYKQQEGPTDGEAAFEDEEILGEEDSFDGEDEVDFEDEEFPQEDEGFEDGGEVDE